MSDISCAVCGEPWDQYGVSHGDMAPWEAKLFRLGAGCPSCEGATPADVTPADAQFAHVQSVVMESEDPDRFPLLHDPEAKRPAWEKPGPVVIFQCAGCDSRIVGDPDFASSSDMYKGWERRTAERYYCNLPGDWYDGAGEDPEKGIREIDGKRYCPACATDCDDCGGAVFRSDTSCTGEQLTGDTYDPGCSHLDPRDSRSTICTSCLEAISMCAHCGGVLEEDEETTPAGYGKDCCAEHDPDYDPEDEDEDEEDGGEEEEATVE